MDPHLREARRQSAAQELGRRNPMLVLYGRPVAVLGGLVVAVLGVWWAVRKVTEADFAPSWRSVLLVVLIALIAVLLVVLIGRSFGGRRGPRPPRMPRGF